MQLDKLETHDRYEHFTKQSFDIAECCQDLIRQQPFGSRSFYIFAHTRTDEDGVTKRLIWQPRLTKPKAQTNSMLFKANPASDEIKVIWMIPARELWNQFTRDKITANETVVESIRKFQFDRESLELREPGDMWDYEIKMFYDQLSTQAKKDKATRMISEALSASSSASHSLPSQPVL